MKQTSTAIKAELQLLEKDAAVIKYKALKKKYSALAQIERSTKKTKQRQHFISELISALQYLFKKYKVDPTTNVYMTWLGGDDEPSVSIEESDMEIIEKIINKYINTKAREYEYFSGNLGIDTYLRSKDECEISILDGERGYADTVVSFNWFKIKDILKDPTKAMDAGYIYFYLYNLRA